MGRPPKVDHIKQNFLKEIAAAEELVRAIRSFSGGINQAGPRGIHPQYVRQVVELAFMGVVASWEEFLERILVRYLAGAKSSTGYSPIFNSAKAKDIPHAYVLLSNRSTYDPTRNYLKVTDPDDLEEMASRFFSNHPFSIAVNYAVYLRHASVIRNKVAHSSRKCTAQFKKTALDLNQGTDGKLKQGYSPGNLLMARATQPFVQTSPSAETYFDEFMSLYRWLASALVP